MKVPSSPDRVTHKDQRDMSRPSIARNIPRSKNQELPELFQRSGKGSWMEAPSRKPGCQESPAVANVDSNCPQRVRLRAASVSLFRASWDRHDGDALNYALGIHIDITTCPFRRRFGLPNLATKRLLLALVMSRLD